jgi:peptide/nickel transport system permease protein
MLVLHSVREKHPACGYALRRIIALIPVLLGVTFLTYGLMYLSPKDPVEMMLQGQGTAPAPEVVEAMRHQLGLDRPFLVQYVDWLYHFVRGDMGVSYLDGAPVAGKLLSALPNTLKLTAASVLVTVLFSLPLGVLTAVKQGKPVDISIRFLSFIGNSLPNYIVSLLLLYVLALKLDWFPILSTGSWDSLVLPTLALAIPIYPAGAGSRAGTIEKILCGWRVFPGPGSGNCTVFLCAAQCHDNNFDVIVHVGGFSFRRNGRH